MSNSTQKTTSILAVIFLTFLFCRKVISQGVVKSPQRDKYQPFIQSEADRWSFEKQMKTVMNVYMKDVEHLAKELIHKRNLSIARLPDYSLKFGAKNEDFKRAGKGDTINGYCKHLSSINLLGESVFVYENTSLIYTSDVKLWEKLECFHEFDVLLGNKSYRGPIKIQYNDMHYQLRLRLDFGTANTFLEDFQPKCLGGTQLEIETPKEGFGLPWLESSIYLSVSEMYLEGHAFDGVVAAIRSILEESTNRVIIRGYLPKLDYERKYEETLAMKKVRKCPEEGVPRAPYEVVSDSKLPYLQNEIEKWAFQKQMMDKLEEFVTYLMDRTASNLAERELLRAKLPDSERLFRTIDKTNTERYGVLRLTNGWILNSYEFVSDGIQQIHLSGKMVAFSARIRLSEPLIHKQDFKAQILLKEYDGKLEGHIDSVTYDLDFLADLQKPILSMEPPTISCIGDLSVQAIGLDGKDDWMRQGITDSAKKELKDRTLAEVHKLISRAIEYVVQETDFTEHLPVWNYHRAEETDLHVRFELQDEELQVCDEMAVVEATEKQMEFLLLTEENGKYQGSDREGIPFNHITRVRQQPVPFITNKPQSWYLEVEMRKKMNEYMYNLLNETKNILSARGLTKVKIADYVQSFSDEGEGNVFFKDGWLENLSSLEIVGVEDIEYNKRKLSLSGKLQLYRYLKYTSGYSVEVRRMFESKGWLESYLPSLMFHYYITVDYLGSMEVLLESFDLHCVSEIKIDFRSADSKEGLPTEDILEATEYVLKHKILDDVKSVVRGAIEDAISRIEVHPFLPEYDYKRDFWAELSRNEKQNRFTNELNTCVSEPSLNEIEALYEGEKTVPYSDVLKDINTEALRSSFNNQIGDLMLRKVNSMWEDVKNGSFQRYNPPKLNDQATAFDAKAPEGLLHRLSVIFNNSWNDGIWYAENFQELKFEFGLNDTLHMWYIQPWENFKVRYDFTVTDHTKNTVVNGSIEAKPENLFYVMKSRFDLHNKSFVVEEYYAYCAQDVEIGVQGVDAEYSWMVPFVEEKMREFFESNTLPSVSDILFVLYGYAADELEADHVLIPWIYFDSLYKIAAQDWNAPNFSEKSIKRCNAVENGYKSSLIRGNMPFIGSEAEWWSFSRQVKRQMDDYISTVTIQAKMFIVENLLAHPKLPELRRRFTAKDPLEREWKSNLTLKVLNAQDLSQLYHKEDYSIKFNGKELTVTSYITFNEDLKFTCNFEALIGDETCPGIIIATAEQLVYEMETRFSLDYRTAEIVRFDLFCIGALELVVTTKDRHMRWASDKISEIASDIIAGMLSDDFRKVMRIAYGYGLLRVDYSDYIPHWNYKKDYGDPPKVEGMKSGFDLCSVNVTSTDLGEPKDEDNYQQILQEGAMIFPE